MFTITRPRLALATALLALLLAAPAAHAAANAGTVSVTNGCGTFAAAPVFLPWEDPKTYALAPGGAFEDGAPGWGLDNGAAIVPGNEHFYLNSVSDAASLSLGRSGKVTSAPFCIGFQSPKFRLVARNLGDPGSKLLVHVLYLSKRAKSQTRLAGTLSATGTWAPTDPLSFAVGQATMGPVDAATVALRFSSTTNAGNWQIDDVYVDPRMRY